MNLVLVPQIMNTFSFYRENLIKTQYNKTFELIYVDYFVIVILHFRR